MNVYSSKCFKDFFENKIGKSIGILELNIKINSLYINIFISIIKLQLKIIEVFCLYKHKYD